MTHVTCRLTARTGISSGTLRSVIEYGLPLPFLLTGGNQTGTLLSQSASTKIFGQRCRSVRLGSFAANYTWQFCVTLRLSPASILAFSGVSYEKTKRIGLSKPEIHDYTSEVSRNNRQCRPKSTRVTLCLSSPNKPLLSLLLNDAK